MTWASAADDPHGWVKFWDLWATDRWEVATRELVTEVLNPGDLFLDIGAWIGPVTLWALQQGAKVIAVEPDPVAREELLNVVARYNKPLPQFVEVWAGALTTTGGPVYLGANPKPEGQYGDSESRIVPMSSIPVQGWTFPLTVESWTLQHILHARVPKLMKMDVEGYEIELAPTIMPWLTENQVAVQISCHGELLDRQLFDGYREVRWPEATWGDIVALP
jgi:FkbM family methyltransferase